MASESSKVEVLSRGLHGYISFHASKPPNEAGFGAGMGFYSAVWPLIAQPLANFQIGLPSTWITPDNSDNKDTPLAPVGTHARDNWDERAPTYDAVFQTVEGGLGYWAGNRFRYGPPKFSMNATPQCYDYEIGSPGWSFFYDTEALPDDRLGIAQLSNRLLIPPDALPFKGNPNGEFFGYTWMALPFTDPKPGEPPTGDQSWTCFISASNFRGPIAYYIPETWSKTGGLFNYPFIYGRGLDSRQGLAGTGAMEINTVPRLEVKDSQGNVFSKIPELQFPIDEQGQSVLVQDVTYYSKAALYDAINSWRNGGPSCSGVFDEAGTWKSELDTRTPNFNQDGQQLMNIDKTVNTKVFDSNVWGLEWSGELPGPIAAFPQYFKQVGEERFPVSEAEVPADLAGAEFELADPGEPFYAPQTKAWTDPGPTSGPFSIVLADGSKVTYSWYRFIDQPPFQQYAWSGEEKSKLQSFVEEIHAHWPIDRDYMPPLTTGTLAALDEALFVLPPKGMEVGYVPIVTRQEAAH